MAEQVAIPDGLAVLDYLGEDANSANAVVWCRSPARGAAGQETHPAIGKTTIAWGCRRRKKPIAWAAVGSARPAMTRGQETHKTHPAIGKKPIGVPGRRAYLMLASAYSAAPHSVHRVTLTWLTTVTPSGP